jgi:ferric enterobactin receptor
MQSLLLFIINIIASTTILAQTPISLIESTTKIQSIVLDSTNQTPLAFVTVTVQKIGKQEISKSTLTDDKGAFEINNLIPRQYQLTLSYVGYKTKTITLPLFTSSTIDLGIIVLAPTATELNEVQVTVQRPLVEQQIDKLTYHVEAYPEANILNSLDLLRKVPLLAVDAEDNLLLNGQDKLLILVNGKRSSLFSGNPTDALKGLPASAIKRVEVISSPSARYEAAGAGGIINIVTHKKNISGYNGAINLGASNPSGYSGSSNVMASAGKFGLSGRYSNTYSTSPASRSYLYREDIVRGNRLEQAGTGSGQARSQNLGAELTFELSPQDQITASYSRTRSKGRNEYLQQVTQLNAAGQQTEAFLNSNQSFNHTSGQDLNLDYQRSFKNNERRQLSFSLNLLQSDNESASAFALRPLLNYSGRESTTGYDDRSSEYSVQADYTQPLGRHSLEVGARSAREESNSDFFYQNLDSETGLFMLDTLQSNSFDYHQQIHGAYMSLDLQLGKWGIRTGARIEEARLDARFRSSGTRAEQHYRNLFPNLSLSRLLRESGTLRLSYSQRIERPSLYYLDPYVDLTDPNNISYGNPQLEPATSHALQLEYNMYVKSTTVSSSLFHHFTNNSIQSFTTLREDSVARTTFGNTGQNRNYGLAWGITTTWFQKLSLNLNGRAQYVHFTNQIEGQMRDSKGFNYQLQGNSSYRFGKNWRASGNISYNSPNVLLQGRTVGYIWSAVSLNKQFMKDQKASLSLSVRSPLQKYRRTASQLSSETFFQHRESLNILRQYNLAFSYRFSKLK